MQFIESNNKDCKILTKIAFLSKAYWGYSDFWLTNWSDLLTVTKEFFQDHIVIKLIEKEEILGFYSLSKDIPDILLDHFWILPENIGKGFGKKMFDHMKLTARAIGAKTITLDSDPRAEGFYKKMGAKTIEMKETFIEKEKRIIPVMLCDV